VRTLASIAARPGYWVRMLRNEAIDFANFAGHDAVTIKDTGQLFNPAIGWDDIAELRSRWPGKLVIKGPLDPRTRRKRGRGGSGRCAAFQPRRAPARPGGAAGRH
jgi:isopentenyl diphosphate isomerase/L-lactate dehydrogenase-like FMN-dependent dehydrogenase